MTDLRIADAPELTAAEINDSLKVPTGGYGNYSITMVTIRDWLLNYKMFSTQSYVDTKVGVVTTALNTHTGRVDNPHQVTKAQVGLSNVDNTSDINKPISAATQTALTNLNTSLTSVISVKANTADVNTQLALKANKTDVYTKSETYTKQESGDLVNNSISTALTPVNTSLDLAKRGIANRYDSLLTYNSGERVILVNGDIVKSTINGNTNDPNVDMTGWVYAQDASFVVDASGKTQQEVNDSALYQCDTVAELDTIYPRAANHIVHVRRFSTNSKYIGGVNYRWDATSTDVVNGFETIASSTTTTGRWKAIFKDNVINAWSVGYIGDGVTSNHLVHEKVSEFLKNSNESWKLIFSNGTFLFNHKHNRFWLVSNVNYHVKSTATIKGGIAFDDDIVWFASQYDTANPLKSTSITGKGTFDMSDTGMMASAYKVRVMFYMLNPINLLVDGLKFTGGDFSQVFVTGETGYTSDDVLIKNCRFDIPVSASPSSKNDDHTTIYTQATNTVVRNNRFYSSNIRARCISTAIEFHEKDGVFESNALDDLAVGMYIAPQERTDCSNIQVLNNTCRLSNLFVSFWANSGADRLINDIVIRGNKVKQNLYPDAATLAANGLIVKTEGLRFLSFIHESGFAATNNYISNGIDVSGNTFEHSLTGTNDQCQLLYLFCNPPENINFSNNTLKVNAFINSSGLVNGGLDAIAISNNSIDSRYLSTTVAPFSLNIASMSKCYFDMSDIEYLDATSRAIPMFSFGSSSIPMTLNTIIEGKESRAIYNRSTYPSALFGNANANNVGIVVQTTLTIPSGVTGACAVYTNTSSFDRFTTAKVLYSGVHLDSSKIIPDTLKKRSGDTSAFVGVGYTNPALGSASTNDVWLYIS